MDNTIIKDHLTAWVGFMKNNSSHKDLQYLGFEDLLLQEAEYFEFARRPKGIAYGKLKECYKNATRLALSHERYTYCEGYAWSGVIPVQHAWCYDEETGKVVDTTWREAWSDLKSREYFGIKIGNDFLSYALLRNKVYGVFSFPLIIDLMKKKLPDLMEADSYKLLETKNG